MLNNRTSKVKKKFPAVGFSPAIQYVMVTKTVGRTSSMGRSPVVRAMKYEESRYIPEDLSFMSIDRSCGNVKIAWKRGKNPQNPAWKKRSPICAFIAKQDFP